MAITILTGIEDTLALIHECGANLARIESTLLPALRKLCASNTSEGESTRNAAAGSSRTRENTGASELVLCQPIQGNIDPLTVLNPATHSVGVLHILAARATHASALPDDATTLLPHISAFVQRFDAAQVQLAGDKVTQLVASFSGLADRITNPESALQLLQGLASRFITRPESITTLHPLLAYQYLKTARYAEAATMLLDLPLIDADTSVTPLAHSDILQYFYYAGLIYIKLDRLEDAIDALETCISSPAVAVSAIHMDAYKKLLLVQLLAHGKTSPVPKYIPQTITRTFKKIAHPYLAFVAAYESRDAHSTQQVQQLVEEKQDTFEKVRNGWVHATLSPPPGGSSSSNTVTSDWVVNFDPFGGDAYTSAASISLLEGKIKTAKQYQTLLQQRDRDIEKSHAYLTRTPHLSIAHLPQPPHPLAIRQIRSPLDTQATSKMVKRSAQCKFPVARIKKIMQADEDVGKVAQATPVLISKALELFMASIVEETVKETRSCGAKKMTPYHVKRTVHTNETFDFLKDIVAKIPDPVETDSSVAGSGAAAGDNRGGKRRKTAKNAEESD
ncbi:related to cop9 complex subunit 3 [Ustilago bromivora]|uniref:Related to cop9 complex subunit 3 n=3 Tax=Ustilago TaxID=5269 RepID=A0A8H8QGG5_9BASI|nr:related to cop9 complex subunit 3 [Ustilago bromivora]